MKHPIAPIKPHEPRKPQPPPKEVETSEHILNIDLSNYDSFSFESFMATLNDAAEGKDKSKLTINVVCEVEHGYYNDVSAKGSLNLCEKKMIPNPHIKAYEDRYKADLKAYEKDKAKYDAEMVEYEKKLKEYKDSLPAWEEYEHKKAIEFHEKQLKRLKSKAKSKMPIGAKS